MAAATHDVPPPIGLEHPAKPQPLPLHTRVALGDAEAFSILANQHYQRACDGSEPAVLALAQARVYARLAAMARGTREDWLSFLFILDQQAVALRQAGLTRLADESLGEAVALAEYMADDGDEEVGQMIASAGQALSAGALNVARELRERVSA